MVLPFGFSVGDFIAVVNLTQQVLRALNDSRGASTDYRDLIKSLSSLHHSLQTACHVFLGLSFNQGSGVGEPDRATVNGIRHELQCCKDILEGFLVRTNKYTQTLLNPRSMKGKCRDISVALRQISWTFKKDDVSKLERDLKSHVEAFGLYAVTIQYQVLNRAEHKIDQVAATTTGIELRLSELYDLMKIVNEALPKTLGNPWEVELPLYFQDAIGRNISIPLVFCSTKEAFHDALVIMFRGLPGHEKVESLEYRLQNQADGSVIQTEEWKLAIAPGKVIMMSILLQALAGLSDQSCPRCAVGNSGAAGDNKMNRCRLCQFEYEIVDRERIVELPDDAEPECQQPTAVEEAPVRKPDRKWTEKEFHRVSYIREKLTLKYPPVPSPLDAQSDMSHLPLSSSNGGSWFPCDCKLCMGRLPPMPSTRPVSSYRSGPNVSLNVGQRRYHTRSSYRGGPPPSPFPPPAPGTTAPPQLNFPLPTPSPYGATGSGSYWPEGEKRSPAPPEDRKASLGLAHDGAPSPPRASRPILKYSSGPSSTGFRIVRTPSIPPQRETAATVNMSRTPQPKSQTRPRHLGASARSRGLSSHSNPIQVSVESNNRSGHRRPRVYHIVREPERELEQTDQDAITARTPLTVEALRAAQVQQALGGGSNSQSRGSRGDHEDSEDNTSMDVSLSVLDSESDNPTTRYPLRRIITLV